MAGVGDLAPAGPTPRRQRCPLVGPVAVVHARALRDDDAAAAAAASCVVRGVSRRVATVVVAEVGDVRAEHHPVGCLEPAELERLQQPHRLLADNSRRAINRLMLSMWRTRTSAHSAST